MNEPLRMVADWLGGRLTDYQDQDQGLNAQLQAIPLDPGDQRPPEIRAVYDITRDNRVIKGDEFTDLPAVVVMYEAGAESEGHVITGYREIHTWPIAFRVLTAKQDTALAVQEANYLLRALVRSLTQFHRNENVERRRRGGLVIDNVTRFVFGQTWATVGNAAVVAGAVAWYHLRDETP